jgi:hypothetical protein
MPSSTPPAPLLITAELPPDVFAWAEGLRQRHFPPERNRVRAHVTLFHALPPSVEDEVRRELSRLARGAPPPARITGLLNLGRGTAFSIVSDRMLAIRAELAERLHTVLTAQDRQKARLHITVQNKVPPAEAKALQEQLGATFQPREFAFTGLALHRWRGGPWESAGRWSFRGAPVRKHG